MHPFTTTYTTKAIPALSSKFTYSSPYLIPTIEKVVVNIGVGDLKENSGSIEAVAGLLTKITGQKPILTRARIAVSGFKIRQNMIIGMKVTLRGKRMLDFMQKFTTVALPRTRDFRGITPTSVTKAGILNVGIKDSSIFPEVAQENLTHPMQITIVSRTNSDDEARTLYESLGFIFQQHD